LTDGRAIDGTGTGVPGVASAGGVDRYTGRDASKNDDCGVGLPKAAVSDGAVEEPLPNVKPHPTAVPAAAGVARCGRDSASGRSAGPPCRSDVAAPRAAGTSSKDCGVLRGGGAWDFDCGAHSGCDGDIGVHGDDVDTPRRSNAVAARRTAADTSVVDDTGAGGDAGSAVESSWQHSTEFNNSGTTTTGEHVQNRCQPV
jgi:hypothetical protein